MDLLLKRHFKITPPYKTNNTSDLVIGGIDLNSTKPTVVMIFAYRVLMTKVLPTYLAVKILKGLLHDLYPV